MKNSWIVSVFDGAECVVRCGFHEDLLRYQFKDVSSAVHAVVSMLDAYQDFPVDLGVVVENPSKGTTSKKTVRLFGSDAVGIEGVGD